MRHLVDVEGKSVKHLADLVGDLRYDALRDFLFHLGVKLEQDAAADKARGRKKLAAELAMAAVETKWASDSIQNAWAISQPFMPCEHEDQTITSAADPTIDLEKENAQKP